MKKLYSSTSFHIILIILSAFQFFNEHMHTNRLIITISNIKKNYYTSFNFIGDITIPGGMTLTVDSDLNGPSPQFTLTCISAGGPATTVTWTRDSDTAMGEFNSTTLDNATTAQYTHTLTVTGRLGGLYQCSVENIKPSVALESFTVQGKACNSALMTVIILTYRLEN